MDARREPIIIQGGMGVAVSGWQLARAVSLAGQLGVVSGTAMDVVLARRLQMGDPGGHMRRALAHFPHADMADRILDQYFIPGGKDQQVPFRPTPMPSVDPSSEHLELIVAANFAEVYLAGEGHDGLIGVNYLEKIQLPTLASLYGAILAGVDYVLGLPLRWGLGWGLRSAGSTDYIPEGRIAFWGGWGGSIVTADADRGVTFAYVMNRMSDGILASERGRTYLRAVYDAL